MLQETKQPRPSWDDLSPSEKLDLQLAPVSLFLLCAWFYLVFWTEP
jgi:hypothetical protein